MKLRLSQRTQRTHRFLFADKVSPGVLYDVAKDVFYFKTPESEPYPTRCRAEDP